MADSLPRLSLEATIELLREALGARLEYPPHAFQLGTKFQQYGLDSLAASQLTARLATAPFARPLSPTHFWEYPTLELLASYLSGLLATSIADSPSSPLAPLERIAIVGMACRFPDAPSLSAFWSLLESGRDAIREVPDGRWTKEEFESPSANVGGFLENVDRFDADFFGITRREASLMDPQQRLMLELAWEALEDAGIRPDTLRGSNTGVFAGAMWVDFETLTRRTESGDRGAYTCSGLHRSILANRISYVLGLHGPSLAVDSACSTGLVAVELACTSLQRGESTLAIAGAVNLNLIPDSALEASKLGALSTRGRCFAFDDRADGYVRGEGGGLVVLKPLSRAIEDGDRIYCVVRGSAVNNDGASNGLTAPNPRAQEAMLRSAYRRAGIRHEDVQYVEAHGTGTPLGDPIEVRSLGIVLGAGRVEPLRIGSVKTNIGHLEAAAGIAGLIKTALAIRHRWLPPSLQFSTPNPLIPFDDLRVAVQATPGEWPDPTAALTAGVSSFGFGGTNAHVVLQEYPPPRAELLAISAASPDALREKVLAIVDGARSSGPTFLKDVCRAADQGAVLPCRLAATAQSKRELIGQLEAFLRNEPHPGSSAGLAAPSDPRGPVFVFSGQGKQRARMGRALLATEPAFRAAIEACDAVVQRLLGWSLVAELNAPPSLSRMDDVSVVVPTIVSLEIGLVALLRHWGIHPGAVVGYSFGEIAAAHCAGILGLDDAVLIACHEGLLAHRTRGTGVMLFVGLSLDATTGALQPYGGRIEPVIHHAPDATVVAGEAAAISELIATCEQRGVFCRRVDMDVAPHSSFVAGLGDELARLVESIRPKRSSVPFVSTLTATVVEGDACGPRHWGENFVSPVRFTPAIHRLVDMGFRTFVEIGPEQLTRRAIQSILSQEKQAGTVVRTLAEGRDDRAAMLDAVGALFVDGSSFDRETLDGSARAAPRDRLRELPLVLSAKSEGALRAQARKLREHLDLHPELELRDVAYSLASTRSHFEQRAALVVQDREALTGALDALARGEPATNVVVGHRPTAGKLVFVFPGQGTQWENMGRALLEDSPVFREKIEACELAFAPYVDWSLTEVLRGSSGAPPIDRLDIVQPVLFAMMVGLAAHWRSLGIEPDAVMGHSQGEIAAAHVAGALSLEDAARVVTLRARALIPFIGKGAMAAVQLPAVELERYLAPFGERVSVAAVNSPTATTIAGVLADVEALVRELESRDISARVLRIDWASHCALVSDARESLLRDLSPVRPQPSSVPIYSTLLCTKLVGTELDADYWYRNVREPVRFLDATRNLLGDGHTFFVEISPHPALGVALGETAEDLDRSIALVPSLRRNEGDMGRLLLSLGELHTRGYSVDWKAFFEPLGARRVELPTYAFQRERYWLDAAPSRSADIASLGLTSTEHPLLGAVVALADGDGFLFTARLSLSQQPWLSGHAVFGHVILPGTAFVELAFAAARHVGLERIDELTLEAPLLLSASAAVCVQLSVSAPDDDGRRAFSIYGRDDGQSDGPWTRFATGTLAPATSAASFELKTWPPPGATVLAIAGLYDRLREAGLEYGPEFQGLRAGYEREGELFAEVVLPEAVAKDASEFGIHPALLDAALHALTVDSVHKASDIGLPFSWSGVTLLATGATTLRVRIAPGAEQGAFSIDVADASGQPVVRIESLALRPVSSEQLALSTAKSGLLRIEWAALQETSSEPPTTDAHWLVLGDDPGGLGQILSSRPNTVVVPLRVNCNCPDIIAAAHRATEQALTFVQAWLADERTASTRLILLTHGAVATSGVDVIDLVHAPIWGLIRTAQTENPDAAIFLVDTDDSPDSRRALLSAIHPAEPQLALRRGKVFVPRLASIPLAQTAAGVSIQGFAPHGTVLITGGTGTLGGMLARHLVRVHGARHLLLASRGGPSALGADSLKADLESLGAEVTVVACDVADRASLEALFEGIPADHPLTAVVHTAGTLDDGLLTTLTPDRLHAVLRTKLDAAMHLHELTESLELAGFVLYSSAAGVVGSAGQANYAAANVFLDALAEHRRSRGLPAHSLDWGYWEEKSGLTARLSAADLGRVARSGFQPISEELGLSLFDVALARPEPQLVAALFDTNALANAPELHPLFRKIVRRRARRPVAHNATAAHSLEEKLQSLSEPERDAELLQLVRTHVALVFGTTADAIVPDRPLKEIGLDSLLAVEIRNRLSAATGQRLRTTLLFDHPTPTALATFIGSFFSGKHRPSTGAIGEREIRNALASIPIERLRQSHLLQPLLDLAKEQTATLSPPTPTNAPGNIAEMDAAELVAFMEMALEVAPSRERG